MPSRPTPVPASPPPGSLPPQLMHSWSNLSQTTTSSSRSRFYEHLHSPPTTPSLIPRCDSPTPLPSSSFEHSLDDVDLESGRRFSFDSPTTSTPTAPRFPTRAFSPAGREALNPLLERPLPQPPKNTLGLSGMSNRLSQKIEVIRQFVNMPYPFHATPPAVPPLNIPSDSVAAAYARLEGTAPLTISPHRSPAQTPRSFASPVPGPVPAPAPVPKKTRFMSPESLARSHSHPTPQRLSDVHVEIEPLRWKRRDEIDIRLRDQRRSRGEGTDKKKKRKKRWFLWCIIIVLILLIIFAVLGGVLGSKAAASASAAASANSTATDSGSVPTPIVTYSLDPTTAVFTQSGTTVVIVSTATVSITATPTSSATPTPSLSPALQSCFTQFQLAAPSSPQTYPCGTCVPLLQTLPNDLSPISPVNVTSLTGGVSPGSALQFCSMQALFLASATSATNASSNPLLAGGWMQDTQPCTWSGVSCDAQGRVTQLVMTFPAVPATLPDQLGGLVALQELVITGNGISPAGAVPPSLYELIELTQIQFVSTGLTGFGSNGTAFGQLQSLQHLMLAHNADLGETLPTELASLPLSTLIVNNQNLTGTALSSLLLSSSLWPRTLSTLDLSSNSLTSGFPTSALPSYTALTELTLASNDLSGSADMFENLPASVQVLVVSGNAGLTGEIPQSLCERTFQSCDFRGTGVTPPGGANSTCGSCLFGSS